MDDAALRRFPKRIHVSMPDVLTRRQLLSQLLRQNEHSLTEEHLKRVASLTEGYSGSDLTNLARDAAMGPVRDIDAGVLSGGRGGGLFGRRTSTVRPISFQDFEKSLKKVRQSVTLDSLSFYERWNEEYGDTE